MIGKYRGNGSPKDREETSEISNAEYESDSSRECERNHFGSHTLTLKGAVTKLVNPLEERGIIIAHETKQVYVIVGHGNQLNKNKKSRIFLDFFISVCHRNSVSVFLQNLVLSPDAGHSILVLNQSRHNL